MKEGSSTCTRLLKTFWTWLNQSRVPHFVVGTVSFIWLVAGVPFLSLYNNGVDPFFSAANKGNQDLANYYMAGSVVLAADFNSLYPVPRENIEHNVGWPDCADSKTGYTQIAHEKGVEESFRFILPPPSALLFVPLAMLPYWIARWVWVICLGASCWGACALAYSLGRKCGCSQFVALVFWIFWAFSPFVMKGLRTANSTPILALFVGLAALGVLENKRPLASISCIVSGLLKGVSIIFVPLILLMKRWRIVLWGITLTLLVNGATVLLGGGPAYFEFFQKVYPSTQIIDLYYDNQSVYGFFYRVIGSVVVTSNVVVFFKVVGWALGGTVLALIFRQRRALAEYRRAYIPAVVALLGIFLIFKPYNWGHYAMCFIPFWPALFALCRKKWQRGILWISAIIMWFPLVQFHGKQLMSSGWLTSPVFIGETLLVALSFTLLAGPVFDGKDK